MIDLPFPVTRSPGRGFLLCIIAILAVLLSGCGHLPVEPVSEEVAKREAGYGRAFGRFVLVKDGKQVSSYTDALGISQYWLFVRSTRTGQMYRMDIKGDGTFIWPLQAGEYVIVAAETFGIRTLRLWLTFSVPQAGQAVYLGDLHLEESKSAYRFGLKDNYDEVLRTIESRLAEANLTPAKLLAQVEQEPGTYKGRWRICADRGGLKCDRNFIGVKPVEPPGAANGSPLVPSLLPLLSWEPSAKEGITYDIAIYETISLNIDMPGARTLRGALVEYAEGLKEPRYQVSKPLKPDTKYDWSVRLRDGDTVSSWSTTGYFAFFIVGWAAGSGQWFGFATPQK